MSYPSLRAHLFLLGPFQSLCAISLHQVSEGGNLDSAVVSQLADDVSFSKEVEELTNANIPIVDDSSNLASKVKLNGVSSVKSDESSSGEIHQALGSESESESKASNNFDRDSKDSKELETKDQKRKKRNAVAVMSSLGSSLVQQQTGIKNKKTHSKIRLSSAQIKKLPAAVQPYVVRTQQYIQDAHEALSATQKYRDLTNEALGKEVVGGSELFLSKKAKGEDVPVIELARRQALTDMKANGAEEWAKAVLAVDKMLKNTKPDEARKAANEAEKPYDTLCASYIESMRGYDKAAQDFSARVSSDLAQTQQLTDLADQYTLEGNKPMAQGYKGQAKSFLEEARSYRDLAKKYNKMALNLQAATVLCKQELKKARKTAALKIVGAINLVPPEKVYPKFVLAEPYLSKDEEEMDEKQKVADAEGEAKFAGREKLFKDVNVGFQEASGETKGILDEVVAEPVMVEGLGSLATSKLDEEVEVAEKGVLKGEEAMAKLDLEGEEKKLEGVAGQKEGGEEEPSTNMLQNKVKAKKIGNKFLKAVKKSHGKKSHKKVVKGQKKNTLKSSSTKKPQASLMQFDPLLLQTQALANPMAMQMQMMQQAYMMQQQQLMEMQKRIQVLTAQSGLNHP